MLKVNMGLKYIDFFVSNKYNLLGLRGPGFGFGRPKFGSIGSGGNTGIAGSTGCGGGRIPGGLIGLLSMGQYPNSPIVSKLDVMEHQNCP